MIALLGSLLGFVGSIIPHIMKLFQDAKDKAHELKMLEMQAVNAEKLREYDAKMYGMRADVAFDITEQFRLLNQNKNDSTGIKWVDAITGSVRPVITYAFFVLYAAIKLITIHNMGIEVFMERPWLVWNDEDTAIFSAIISFWFGERAFRRMGSK